MRRLGCFIRGNSFPIRKFASTCWGWVTVPQRSFSPFAKGLLLQLWWCYLRFILVALSPDHVLILGSYNVSMTICSRRQCISVFHLLNNFSLASSIFVKFSTRYNLQTNSSASWTLDVLRSPSPRCWSSLCTWRTCLMPFSWCGQKSRRWCHNRFRGWKFLSDFMYWKVLVLLLLGHAREVSNPGSLDCESAILPLS